VLQVGWDQTATGLRRPTEVAHAADGVFQVDRRDGRRCCRKWLRPERASGASMRSQERRSACAC
jgi:hypothetical protein